MKTYDVIIIGAGASGLFAAASAHKRDKRVAILEMGQCPARKVMASGGGKCNITNDTVGFDKYFGNNPNFVRSAISKIKPSDILDWAKKHNIELFEKTTGRYFCTDGSQRVVDALISDIKNVKIYFNTKVTDITKTNNLFHILTENQTFIGHSVIIATGGTSFETLGVSDTGYKIAKKFGHKIVPVRPALCILSTDSIPHDFAGISMPVQITVGKHRICDDLLFTHNGIGGPAAYRTSVRDIPDGINIDFLPNIDILNVLKKSKTTNGKKTITKILGEYMPNKIAKWIAAGCDKNIADIKDNDLNKIANKIKFYQIKAENIKFYKMSCAEVVRGGVSTDEISSKTMESKLCKNLFFAGEVLDIAGDLGGFNLHWAWASGYIAGENA